MKYCTTDTCFLFRNFHLKTVKHRMTDEASVELPLDLNTCYLEYENKSSCESNKSSMKCIRRSKMWPTELSCSYSCPVIKSEGKDCFQQAFIDAKSYNPENFHFSLQLDKRDTDHMD